MRRDKLVSFEGIGDVVGGDTASGALGVSGNGGVVVGYGTGPSGKQAIRWSRNGGLGLLLGTASEARAVSRSGDIIVGDAVRWVDGTPEVLRLNPVFHLGITTEGISGNGQLVVGQSFSLGVPIDSGGVTWKAGMLEGQFNQGFSVISGSSETGAVLVGSVFPSRAGPGLRAVKNGAPLPFPAATSPSCREASCGFCITPGQCASRALAVSFDGHVIVGWASFGAGVAMPVAWSTGPDGNPIGNVLASKATVEAQALAVSGDGEVIVGEQGGVATVWTDRTSTSIAEFLCRGGAPVDGWKLTAAHSVSNDGRVIVGEGINPSGSPEGWVAILPHDLEAL